VTDPRPAPDREVAGEPEYGNDTGFAGSAAGSRTGSGSEPAAGGAAAGPPTEPAAAEDAGDDDPGRGAD
jgi:hypothetical protein